MSSPAKNGSASGHCLCGAVNFRIVGPLRPLVSACHCSQCRRFHGAPGAYTSAAENDVIIDGRDSIRWYNSSPDVRRGFCMTCGTTLFWQQIGAKELDIVAGTIDLPSGLTLARHIYTASKGDYEVIADGLPQFPASSRG